ncbi:MAG TPA: hypothetical protein VGS07_14000 [Thermoanaerobaculia bacterium]|jgi:hypothetical protein|nr:hypothetical protein [Thermoanaerobaculia bacterium]
MICPKCGFEQPDGVECMRCGVIVSRYKGPIAGAGPRNTPPAFAPGAFPPPPFIPPPPVIAGGAVHAPIPPPPVISPDGTVFGDSPANSAGGTVYGGPPPPPAGNGAVYGGPGSVAPTFSSFGPGFHGTFEVGKVLGETFSTYFTNFLPFVLLTTLASLPMFVLGAYISSLQHSDKSLAAFLVLAWFPLQLVVSQLAAGGITYGVYQQMRGLSPSVFDCLKVGLSRLLPVLVVAVLSTLATFVGLLFCVIPGIVVATMLAVAVPVTVEERPGIFSAMQRSSYLTESFRWQVFCILFVLWILQQVPIRIAPFFVHDVGSLLTILSFAIVLGTSLSSTAAAVMYYRLRSVKESIDVDQISSVFA